MKQAIVPFKCSDKIIDESWTPQRKKNIANFPSPFRMLLIGGPHMGKSTLAKNLVVHQNPPFDEVYICHEDAGYTTEYADLDPTDILPDIPSLEDWSKIIEKDPNKKRLCIIDDLEFTSAHKERIKNLAVLFRYGSTHKGISVIFCHQSFFDLPPLAKKMGNIFVIWRPRPNNELALIENRVGVEKDALKKVFMKHATQPRDSITIDHTIGSPAEFRINVWQPIKPEQLASVKPRKGIRRRKQSEEKDEDESLEEVMF